MIKYLFPKFLADPAEYRRAAQQWQQRWTELINDAPDRLSWTTPWVATTFADGTPIDDGNPIFSAVCPKRQLGIRVIQNEPSDTHPAFSFWVDTFAKGQPGEVKELVISCVLTT